MKRLLLVLIGCLIGCLSASAQVGQIAIVTTTAGGGMGTPIMFQSITTSTNPAGNGITGRAFVIHTEALPANTVAIMAVTAPVTVTTVSISDTLAGSWSAAICSATGGTGNNKAWLFVQSLGATGGVDAITVAIGSTNLQPVQFNVSFFENLSTADGSLCSTSGGITPTSGGVVSAGAFTPTTNNNANGGHVIYSYTALCGGTGANVVTNWTAASGFSLLNGETAWVAAADAGFPDASQWETQTTNASVTPSFTGTGETAAGDCFNLTAVAVKVTNNSATAPSTIHVSNITHESSGGQASPSTITINMPTTGSLHVLTTTWPEGAPGGAAPTLTSVTSSDSCTWTEKDPGNGGAVLFYAQGCTPSTTNQVTLHITGAGTLPQFSWRMFDVTGALSSSFQNFVGNSGSCTATTSNAPTITPTGASSGLTIASIGIGTGPITALASGAPSNSNFDLWTFTGQTDSDFADNGDGVGHAYYSSTATQHWNWSEGQGTQACYWVAGAFN